MINNALLTKCFVAVIVQCAIAEQAVYQYGWPPSSSPLSSSFSRFETDSRLDEKIRVCDISIYLTIYIYYDIFVLSKIILNEISVTHECFGERWSFDVDAASFGGFYSTRFFLPPRVCPIVTKSPAAEATIAALLRHKTRRCTPI